MVIVFFLDWDDGSLVAFYNLKLSTSTTILVLYIKSSKNNIIFTILPSLNICAFYLFLGQDLMLERKILETKDRCSGASFSDFNITERIKVSQIIVPIRITSTVLIMLLAKNIKELYQSSVCDMLELKPNEMLLLTNTWRLKNFN